MQIIPIFECLGGDDPVVAVVAVVLSMKVVPSFECVGSKDAVVVLEGGVGDRAIFIRGFLLRVSRQTDHHLIDLISVHLFRRPIPPDHFKKIKSQNHTFGQMQDRKLRIHAYKRSFKD